MGKSDTSKQINKPLKPSGGNACLPKCILSTKKLGRSRKTFLESKGIKVVDYNAIRIKFLDIHIPAGFDFLIFTSQNAVKAFLKQIHNSGAPGERQILSCFCVGEKTRALLEANGLIVLFAAANAKNLAQYLAKEHHKNRMLFICGNQRRDELPTLLHEKNMSLTELVVYDTIPTPVVKPGNFDGLLFFSPSGVNSHLSLNNPGDVIVYCIGPTTAAAASLYTDKYKSAEKPTVESLLKLVVADLGSEEAALKQEIE